MDLSKLIDGIIHSLKENAPEILTGLAVVGVGTTAAVAARGGFQAGQRLTYEKPGMTFKEKFKATWPFYVPAVISGVGTTACIILSSKGSAKRTAAAVTAYSVTERAFAEYREKVAEQLKMSEAKQQKAIDAIAEDRVHTNPPIPGQILVLGRGDVLCCELYTGRYFRSEMEALRKAQNDVNHWLVINRRVTLDDFYSLLDLPGTSDSGHLGWEDDELMDLNFSAVLTLENEPCLAFNYNYVRPLK